MDNRVVFVLLATSLLLASCEALGAARHGQDSVLNPPRFRSSQSLATRARGMAAAGARAPAPIAVMATPLGLGCHEMQCVRNAPQAKAWREVYRYAREAHRAKPAALVRLNGMVAALGLAVGNANTMQLATQRTVGLTWAQAHNVEHHSLPGGSSTVRTDGMRRYAANRALAWDLAEATGVGNGNLILAWLDWLSTDAAALDLTTPKLNRHVRVVGLGPAGLAAVAHGLSLGVRVTAEERRCSYTRAHVVDLRNDAGTGAANVNNGGAHGMRTLIESLGVQRAIAAHLLTYVHGGSYGITISDLEYYLALLVWMGHDTAHDTLTWNNCGAAQSYAQRRAATPDINNAAAHLGIAKPAPKLAADAVVVAGAPWPAAGATPKNAPVVFANGAGSPMAAHIRAGGADVRVVDFARAKHAATHWDAEAAHALRHQDNTVVFAMWLFENGADPCPNAVAFAAAVANNPLKFPAFVPEWSFSKDFAAKGQCLFELGFRRDIGEQVLQAFGVGGFSWPTSVANQAAAGYAAKTSILFRMFRTIWRILGHNVNMDMMVEMKVWRSWWGMTTQVGTNMRMPVTAFVPHGAAPAVTVPCGILLGDAERPALTSLAMGVNSAAVEAFHIMTEISQNVAATACDNLGVDVHNDGTVASRELHRVLAIRDEVGAAAVGGVPPAGVAAAVGNNANMAAGLGAQGNWAFAGHNNDMAVLRLNDNNLNGGAIVLRDMRPANPPFQLHAL